MYFFFLLLTLCWLHLGRKSNTKLCFIVNCWRAIREDWFGSRWALQAVVRNPSPLDRHTCWFSLWGHNQEEAYTWDARWRKLAAINYLAAEREAVWRLLQSIKWFHSGANSCCVGHSVKVACYAIFWVIFESFQKSSNVFWYADSCLKIYKPRHSPLLRIHKNTLHFSNNQPHIHEKFIRTCCV